MPLYIIVREPYKNKLQYIGVAYEMASRDSLSVEQILHIEL